MTFTVYDINDNGYGDYGFSAKADNGERCIGIKYEDLNDVVEDGTIENVVAPAAEQPRAAVGETETKEPEKGGKVEKVKNEAAAPKAKIDDAGEREKAQREVEQIASKLEKGNTTKNDELIQRIADMAQEADEALESGNLTDEERLRQQARFDVADAWLENNVRGHRADIVKPVTKREARLRDAIVDMLRKAGIDVVTESEEGQRVLDMANGRDVTLNKAQKRTLETARLNQQEEGTKGTVVSSDDGAKVLKNLDILEENLRKITNRSKTFIGDVAKALGAKQFGSKSQYATFETKNGQTITIRLGNHNATVSSFDNNGEDNGISIVISRHENKGITNDGNAHLVEYFYSDKAINRADGKPLADIVRSIKQALYSGEYKDTTGLAEREEVNAEQVRMHRVYHGSGADFERFDHSHMGEGEGAQAYGWGTYVTEVKGIGRTYAKASGDRNLGNRPAYIASRYDYFYKGQPIDQDKVNPLQMACGTAMYSKNIAEARRRADRYADYAEHDGNTEMAEKWREAYRILSESKKSDFTQKPHKPDYYLYTVEIPDDNGSNYLEWDKTLTDEQKTVIADKLKEQGFGQTKRVDGDIVFSKGDKWIIVGDNFRGMDWYKSLAMLFDGDKATSEFLHSAGFVGIKYPAQYRSGGREDNAKNYVIFNEGDLQITDKVKFFRTESGEAYGFTMGGKIYLDPKIATAETPIHEYTHLWAEALRAANPKAWERLKSELEKDKDLMAYVQRLYPEYYIPRPDGHPSKEGTGMEDELMDEVFAHFSGRRGAERLREEQRKAMDEAGDYVEKAGVVAMFERLRDALKKFWNAARDLFAGKTRGIKSMSAEDFADMVLGDLVGGFKPDRGNRVDRSDRERDAEYMEAVNRGDMETAQRLVDEAAREAGYISENDFRMRHTAPNGRDGFSRSIDDVSGIYPEDLYSPNGYHYYGDGDVRRDRFCANVFSRVRNNPEALVKIYRAVPKTTKETKLRNGDWVSVNREYAKEHGERNINGGYKIIEDEVPAKYVYTDGNSLHEQGYDDGKEYVYQNTKNNRKLIDPVTYDDAGNVIPLSKRFNKRNADIRYEKVGGDENNNRAVTIIGAEKEHGFANFVEARKWAKKNIVGEYNNPEIGGVNISGTAIDKYLSEKAVSKSDNKDVHLSALKVMPSIIENSIVGEILGDKKGDRHLKDIVRLYGAINLDGQSYRVKTTVKRYNSENEKSKAYSYEVTEIELLEGTHGDDNGELPRSGNNSILAAKLLKNIDKSYDKGKKNLDESDNELEDSDVNSSSEGESTPEGLNGRSNENLKRFKEILDNSGLRYRDHLSFKNGSRYFTISIRDKNGDYYEIRMRVSDHAQPKEWEGNYVEGVNDFRNYADAYNYLSQFFDLSDKRKVIEEKRRELSEQVEEVEFGGEKAYRIKGNYVFGVMDKK